MNPSRTFSGVYSSFLVYVALGAIGFAGLLFLSVSIVNPPLALFFLVSIFASSIIWLVHRNHIRSITFGEDHVMVVFILFRKERVAYRNLQKYRVKIEGFNNKTISTIHYLSPKGKVKTVDFRTYNLDHQQFKAELIELKKGQLSV